MSSTNPVRPSEFRQVVPDTNDSICTVFVKLFKWMILFWKWYRWAFVYNTGELSDEFAAQLCAEIRNCEETENIGD